jgi:hypothetical protein
LTDQFRGIEQKGYQSKINIPYLWWAGNAASILYCAVPSEIIDVMI